MATVMYAMQLHTTSPHLGQCKVMYAMQLHPPLSTIKCSRAKTVNVDLR
jgi:hypothetical protein